MGIYLAPIIDDLIALAIYRTIFLKRRIFSCGCSRAISIVTAFLLPVKLVHCSGRPYFYGLCFGKMQPNLKTVLKFLLYEDRHIFSANTYLS